MTTVTRSHQILVDAPLPSAFEYVADLSRHPEWSDGQLRIEELTPGPIAVGKEYVSHGEVAVQKDRRNTVRITEYRPPHTFGFVANDPDFGDTSHVFKFTEQSGAVLITRTMTLSLNPVMALLFRFFIYPLIGRPAMNKSLALLKAKLEEQF
jgi:uncharacterized protein YndB with AHSA1/START domain